MSPGLGSEPGFAGCKKPKRPTSTPLSSSLRCLCIEAPLRGPGSIFLFSRHLPITAWVPHGLALPVGSTRPAWLALWETADLCLVCLLPLRHCSGCLWNRQRAARVLGASDQSRGPHIPAACQSCLVKPVRLQRRGLTPSSCRNQAGSEELRR